MSFPVSRREVRRKGLCLKCERFIPEKNYPMTNTHNCPQLS